MNAMKIQQWLLLCLTLIALVCITQGCKDDEGEQPDFVPNAETEYDGNSFRVVSLFQQINIDGENLFIDGEGLLQYYDLYILTQNEQNAVLEIMDIQQSISGIVLPPQPKPCPIGSEGYCMLKLSNIRCSVFSNDECLEVYPFDLPEELILRAVPGSQSALNESYAGQHYVEVDFINQDYVGDARGAYKHNTGQMYYFNTRIVE